MQAANVTICELPSGTADAGAAPTITSINVDPDPAPPSTQRTITVNATSTGALAYLCTVDGVPAQQTSLPNVFTIIL